MTFKKKLLLSILLLLMVVGSTAVYFYNKTGINVQRAQGIQAGAGELYATFFSDSGRAKQMYAGEVLEVSGEIAGVSKNQQQQSVVLLKTFVAGAFVNCTMEDTGSEVVAGEHAAIKGICTGMGQGDDGLGIPGDVYLQRCYLSK